MTAYETSQVFTIKYKISVMGSCVSCLGDVDNLAQCLAEGKSLLSKESQPWEPPTPLPLQLCQHAEGLPTLAISQGANPPQRSAW